MVYEEDLEVSLFESDGEDELGGDDAEELVEETDDDEDEEDEEL
ncbi:MAG: hypothetical protein Q8P39_03215 [Candidatus Yanofskybacteria bacterium]|nr:hypothetical protein [Candidatus Yanofskybacteria bacterium]